MPVWASVTVKEIGAMGATNPLSAKISPAIISTIIKTATGNEGMFLFSKTSITGYKESPFLSSQSTPE